VGGQARVSTAMFFSSGGMGGFRRPFGMLGGGTVIHALYAFELLRQIARLPQPPPLTLSIMAFNIVSFVMSGRRLPVMGRWPSVQGGALQPQRATLLLRVLGVALRGGAHRLKWGASRGFAVVGLASRELGRRTLFSQLLHADTLHLFYNMTSLLWKGAQLEEMLGPLRLLRLVLWSLCAGPTLHVSSAQLLARFGYSRALRVSTAPGPSPSRVLLRCRLAVQRAPQHCAPCRPAVLAPWLAIS
jgi:hypothetical protein